MLAALIGGALIGLAATWLWLANGRIAGISGILRGALLGGNGPRGELITFLAGLMTAGLIAGLVHRVPAAVTRQGLPVVLLAGVLVGFGTRVGGGCTSGHGVCGLSRLSRRSLVATLTFVGAGAVTVWLIAHGADRWHWPCLVAWGVR
jgi:uncharacterized protein